MFLSVSTYKIFATIFPNFRSFPSEENSGKMASIGFRWLDILEKEFDKAFVDIDLVLGEVESDEPNVVFNVRQKLCSLTSCFAQLTHKAQTVFQNSAKLEAELIHLRTELVESKAKNHLLENELHNILLQLHSSQLSQLPESLGNKKIDAHFKPDVSAIKKRLEAELRQSPHRLTRSVSVSTDPKDKDDLKLSNITAEPFQLKMENSQLQSENTALRNDVLTLTSEVYGAKLAAKYLDKELAGRIQQLQLLGREMRGDVRDKLWRQLESEILLQRHKTVVRACRRNSSLKGHEKGNKPAIDCGANGDTNHFGDIRVVVVKRKPDQGLGISITGGREHGVPILISELESNGPAARSDQLYIGDAILYVNDIDLRNSCHKEAVSVLQQQAGDCVFQVQYIAADDSDNSLEEDGLNFRFFNDDIANPNKSIEIKGSQDHTPTAPRTPEPQSVSRLSQTSTRNSAEEDKWNSNTVIVVDNKDENFNKKTLNPENALSVLEIPQAPDSNVFDYKALENTIRRDSTFRNYNTSAENTLSSRKLSNKSMQNYKSVESNSLHSKNNNPSPKNSSVPEFKTIGDIKKEKQMLSENRTYSELKNSIDTNKNDTKVFVDVNKTKLNENTITLIDTKIDTTDDQILIPDNRQFIENNKLYSDPKPQFVDLRNSNQEMIHRFGNNRVLLSEKTIRYTDTFGNVDTSELILLDNSTNNIINLGEFKRVDVLANIESNFNCSVNSLNSENLSSPMQTSTDVCLDSEILSTDIASNDSQSPKILQTETAKSSVSFSYESQHSSENNNPILSKPLMHPDLYNSNDSLSNPKSDQSLLNSDGSCDNSPVHKFRKSYFKQKKTKKKYFGVKTLQSIFIKHDGYSDISTTGSEVGDELNLPTLEKSEEMENPSDNTILVDEKEMLDSTNDLVCPETSPQFEENVHNIISDILKSQIDIAPPTCSKLKQAVPKKYFSLHGHNLRVSKALRLCPNEELTDDSAEKKEKLLARYVYKANSANVDGVGDPDFGTPV